VVPKAHPTQASKVQDDDRNETLTGVLKSLSDRQIGFVVMEEHNRRISSTADTHYDLD
jgi:hypothetical protein